MGGAAVRAWTAVLPIVSALLELLLVPAATAAAPAALIELAAPPAGGYELFLGVSILPAGFVALAREGHAPAPAVAVAEYGIAAAGGVTYYVSESFGVSLSAAGGGIARGVASSAQPALWQWESAAGSLDVGGVWRWASPGAGRELRLEAGSAGVSVHATSSLVSDPLVLSADLGLEAARDDALRFAGSAGAVLVVNEEWAWRVALTHRLSLSAPAPPQVQLALGVVHLFGGPSVRQAGVEAVLQAVGSDVRVGIGFAYYGAGRRR